MAFSITRNEKPSAYIITFDEDYDSERDAIAFYQELNTHLDTELAPLAVILEATNFRASFNDIVALTKNAMNLSDRSPLKHPQVQQIIVVTENSLFISGLNGFQKLVGIGKKFHATQTLDNALALVIT